MLMATAITLLMMAAIVTLFANLSGGIRNRRAVIELSGQLRQVRQMLARDLEGCTVPSGDGGLLPWRQRPGEAIGYFEIVEGFHSDAFPSQLINGVDTPKSDPPDFELDHATTIVPGSQLADFDNGEASDGRALGDYDDILALTVRALDAPFVGTYDVPNPNRDDLANPPNPDNDADWIDQTIESPLAEVIWYALEDPADDPTTPDVDESVLSTDDPGTTVNEEVRGEPGMRRIYRRVLLIAPWLTELRQPTGPGSAPLSPLEKFSLTNDVSVRRDREGSGQIVANTLADLTRREYRFGRGGGIAVPLPL